MKRCTKCGIEKELDAFNKHRRDKDGLSYWCRDCTRLYRIGHKEQTSEYHKEYDKTHAEHLKQYREEHKEDIRQYAKQYQEEHKKRYPEYHKEYQRTHAEHIKQYREENKEKISEHGKQYRKEHREHYIGLNKQWRKEHVNKTSEKMKIWRKNNPEKSRLSGQKREARKRQLQATLTGEQWMYIKERFDNKCAYCGKDNKLEQEHFIALSSQGEYGHNNIVCSCRSCNASKRSSSFFDWYPKQTFYSKRREAKILKFLNYKNEVQQLEFCTMILRGGRP